MPDEKCVIDMSELKKYIYSMTFKGNVVKALDSEGYYHAVYPYLDFCDSEMLHYGPTVTNGTVTYCVVKATVAVRIGDREISVSAIGSCGSNEDRMKLEHMADVAETRAKKRAIHQVLDMSKYDIRDVESGGDGSSDTEAKRPPSGGTLNSVSVPDAVRSGVAAGGDTGWRS